MRPSVVCDACALRDNRGMPDEPPPERPEKPLPSDCCEAGCERCVLDVYAEQMARYEAELTAWRARQHGHND